ncbi:MULTISPECIES: hypothetical protein [unclassified Microcoleus]|uniref:hypothetical protein n=1 Tax=unclassified Microcoleus TaxID=2642155 RepID=UPI002FD0A7DA
MNTQLSLFDASTAVEPAYKIGDRVKLRKKPIAASYVKKGDIVEIAAIHPTNGSIKFWNERSERWEFIYPEEIGRVFDSPTPVEPAVGESTSPHSETYTNTQVEAVGESTSPPGKIDSPTPVEPAVGESNCRPGDDCLALNAISTYRPRGTARSGEYYRLSYKDGGKVKQVHIRGGNTDSPIAQAKVQEVRSLLAIGNSPAQIAEMLRK